MIVKVQQDQTIYDIANQYYGSVEGVFKIIEDNPGVDLETPLDLSQELKIDENYASDSEVKAYMNSEQVKPNNGNVSQAPTVSAFTNGFKQDSVT